MIDHTTGLEVSRPDWLRRFFAMHLHTSLNVGIGLVNCCIEKTANGNFYRCRAVARDAAKRATNRGACRTVHEFRCLNCGLYHIGKVRA